LSKKRVGIDVAGAAIEAANVVVEKGGGSSLGKYPDSRRRVTTDISVSLAGENTKEPTH
jgi:hypothetical protein